MTDTPRTDPKGRRVTIDLTPAASRDVDRLRDVTGLTTADVFRHALSLFRIYVDAKKEGREFELVDQSKKQPNTRIELPLSIESFARS